MSNRQTLFTVLLTIWVFALGADATAQQPASQVLAQDSMRESTGAAVFGRQPVRVSAYSSSPPASLATEDQGIHTESVSTDGFPALNRSVNHSSDNRDDSGASPRLSITSPLVSVCSSLAIVLGLFAVFVWVTRKYSSRSLANAKIPSEVLQSLGSTAIDPRTRISMLRVGGRILVVAQTATGIEPLSEITDPDEVSRLTAACLGHAKDEFASTLASIEREPAPKGFAGQRFAQAGAASNQPAHPRSSRLFATA